MHISLVGPLTGTGMVNTGHQVFSFVESESSCHDQLLLQCQSTRTESMETLFLMSRSAAFDVEQMLYIGKAAMHCPCRCHLKRSLRLRIFRFQRKFSSLPYVVCIGSCNIFGIKLESLRGSQ